jgi:hypothetical protein
MFIPQHWEGSQQPGHGCQTSHGCELPWQLSRQASDRHVCVAGSHLHVGPPRRLHFLLRLHGWPPHAAGRDAAVDVSTGAAYTAPATAAARRNSASRSIRSSSVTSAPLATSTASVRPRGGACKRMGVHAHS